MRCASLALLALLALGGCATNQPIVYSQQGAPDKAASKAVIADCEAQAEAAGATRYGGSAGQVAGNTARSAAVGAAGGAVGGAIAGNALQGAGIGAASAAAISLVQNLLAPPAPNPAYRAFVERCLRDKGVEIVGWQ